MNIVAHNMLAMNANRQFNITNNNTAKSIEKLSSGYRINRAADDAARLSISEKMRRQIRGLSRGIENTQDGMSVCQVADAALAEVSDMLHRITELSVQSANGTNSDEDRKSIQQEISQILQEIDRIGVSTEFNTKKIFDGTAISGSKNHVEAIQHSLYITAKGSNISSVGNHVITATNNGIAIDGNIINYNNIRNTAGNSFDVNNIEAGTYSINNNDLFISFDMQAGSSIHDLKEAINNTSFDIIHKNYNVTYNATLKLEKAIDSDNFLLSNTHSLHADATGMWVNSYNKISWSSMGINNSNIAGKTIEFKDSQSGVSLKIKCTDTNSDLNSLIDSINNGTLDVVKDLPRKLWSAGYDYTVGKVKIDLGGNCCTFGEKLMDDLGLSESDKLSAHMKYKVIGTSLNDMQCIAECGGKTIAMGPPSSSAIAYYMNLIRTSGSVLMNSFKYGGDSSLPIYISVSNADKSNVSETEVFDAIKQINEKIPLEVTVEAYGDSKFTPANVTIDENRVENIKLKEINNSTLKTNVWIQSGSEEGQGICLSFDSMNTHILGIESIDVSTASGADNALAATQHALEKVSSSRSTIGAQQNRLEHMIANEQNVVENTTTAESRIRDTDMSKETVELSKNMFLNHVGQAMLAQANKSTHLFIT